MYSNIDFWYSLASLSLIVLYAILVFKNVNPLVAIVICVIGGFIFNHSNPLQIGKTLEGALGSFLALIGFIIMLGRGLGEVLNATQTSHTLVHKIVHSIGVNTQTRVKIGVIISSITIVGVLGTLAGGLAILAPILRPIARKVGLSKPSLAVLMQASGEEALILGPFTPPIVALIGVTGLNYSTILIHAAIPISIVTLVVTWLMAKRLQKQYPNELFTLENITFSNKDNKINSTDQDSSAEFCPTKRNKFTTYSFIFIFIACIIYGLISHAKTSYVIFVMLFLAISNGFIGKLSLNKIFELLLDGMKKNFHLFIIFILLDPFLNLIQTAGGFHALTELFIPLEHLGGKTMLATLIGITGAFGLPAAAAAVIQMLYQIFSPIATEMQLPMITFAFSMLLATRITNFAYPGPNMFAAMGFADCTNIKAMIKNGLVVTLIQVAFLIIYSVLFAN